MKTFSCKDAAVATCCLMLALMVAVEQGYAQAQVEPNSTTKLAKLNEPAADESATDIGGTATAGPGQIPPAADASSTAAIENELQAMKLRIQQLEAQLGERTATAAEHPAMEIGRAHV